MMEQDVISKIFINYAEEDNDSAMRLYNDLKENSNTKLWIDKKNLLVGVEWKPAIKKAINEADYFITLLSDRSTSKYGFVQEEIRESIKKRNKLPRNHLFILPISA
jgi:TIR domain-containing protein